MIARVLASRVFRASGVYALVNGLSAGVPLVLAAVLSHYIAPESYGLIAMAQVLVSVALPLVGLNLHAAAGRRWIDRERGDFAASVSSSLALAGLAGLVVALLVWAGGEPLARLVDLPLPWLHAVVPIAMAQVVGLYSLTLWQMQQKPWRYGAFRVAQTGGDLGLVLLLVAGLGWGWEGRLAGQLVAYVAAALVSLALLRRGGFLPWRFDRQEAREALSFSLPLVPHLLGAWVMAASDRLFISKMVGLEAVGLYAAGYQVGMVLSLVQNSLNQAWVPWLFQELKDDRPGSRLLIVRISYGLIALLLAMALLLGLAGPAIMGAFFADSYREAGEYILWVALGYAFAGAYKLVGNYLFYARRTAVLAWITGSAAVLNLLLNYLFIRLWGPVGAARATAVCLFLEFAVTWHVSRRVFPMPYLAALSFRKAR